MPWWIKDEAVYFLWHLSVPTPPLPLSGDAKPILAVSQHTALRSPDFPPRQKAERSPDLLAVPLQYDRMFLAEQCI